MDPKSLIFTENVLYWAHYKPNPAMRILGVSGSRANNEQGRGSSARRLCHRKRVKRVFPRVPKKPLRLVAVHPRAVSELPQKKFGPPPRRRLQNPRKTKEAQCPTRLQKLPRSRLVRRPLFQKSQPSLRRRPLPRLRSSRPQPNPSSPASQLPRRRALRSRRRR